MFFQQSRRRAALPQGVVIILWERSSDRDVFPAIAPKGGAPTGGCIYALWERSSDRDSFSIQSRRGTALLQDCSSKYCQHLLQDSSSAVGVTVCSPHRVENGKSVAVAQLTQPTCYRAAGRRSHRGDYFALWERSSDRDSFSQQSRRRTALPQGVIAVILYSVDASQRVPFLFS